MPADRPPQDGSPPPIPVALIREQEQWLDAWEEFRQGTMNLEQFVHQFTQHMRRLEGYLPLLRIHQPGPW